MDLLAMHTRSRLHLAISAFEVDIREHLKRYVVPYVDEVTLLGSAYDEASRRRARDAFAGESTSLVYYLDLRDGYDLLNVHRAHLPEELSREVRQLTTSMDQLVPIRNRVMHSRPLAPGDQDLAASLLVAYRAPQWESLQRAIEQLRGNPDWQPAVSELRDEDPLLHNLPAAEYDETGLVGRQREVEDLVRLIKLGREPVITITGEGGIGKTALALEVAYRLVDDPDCGLDAILWTSLKHERLTAVGVRDIEGAARDLLTATRILGTALSDDFTGTTEDLAAALQGINALIVIDNLETIGGSEFRTLYEQLPTTVRFLVTSRSGIGELERRYELGELGPADSLRLLNTLLQARRVDRLLRVDGPARQAIVAKLRNSPLAIRWFVLAVEAGKDPVEALQDQRELLEFCVRSVYDELSPDGKEVLGVLKVMDRPATPAEIVVLLERPEYEVSRAIQEVARGSLVRRETRSVASELVTRIAFTDTARQFIEVFGDFDSDTMEDVASRYVEFQRLEQRRGDERSSRSLDPIIILTDHDHEGPAALKLRQALLESRKDRFDEAFALVAQARKLSPEFYEVDRVEGFLRSTNGQAEEASLAYEAGYAKATGVARARIGYFYSTHLARREGELARAIEMSQESHAELDLPDTGVRLGTFLIWDCQYEKGIATIREWIDRASGKLVLIANTTICEGYRRWAEFSRDRERNPLQQFMRGQMGLAYGVAALEAGFTDERLRQSTLDCAIVTLAGLVGMKRSGQFAPESQETVKLILRLAPNVVRNPKFDILLDMARQVAALWEESALRQVPSLLEGMSRDMEDALRESESPLIGRVATLSAREYGWIAYPSFARDVFFHSTVVEPEFFSSLRVGDWVAFGVEESDKGVRATWVTSPFDRDLL